METFPEDPFEKVTARIISSDEWQVSWGGNEKGWGGGDHRIAVFGREGLEKCSHNFDSGL